MKNISFPVPKGFTPPEGVKEGDLFDFMASGYFKGNTMYVTAVEGSEVDESASEGKKEKAAEQSSGKPEVEMGMVDAVEKGMAQPGMA